MFQKLRLINDRLPQNTPQRSYSQLFVHGHDSPKGSVGSFTPKHHMTTFLADNHESQFLKHPDNVLARKTCQLTQL